MQRYPSKSVSHRGITTSYYDEGNGPVLLMVHGFTGGKLDFHDQIGHFTDRFRVIAPDNRGHGESDNTGDVDSYTLEALVDDLYSFVTTLGLSEIHLLGHSLGGMAVMRYALAHPETLKSLMLMDTSPKIREIPVDYFAMMEEVLTNQGPAALVALMKKIPPTSEVKNGIDLLGETEHWARIEEKLRQMDVAAYRGFAQVLRNMPDVTDALAAISCPTTVLVGSADTPFLEASTRMAEVIPGARLKIIADASHCPQYENAKVWREVINEHLRDALT